MQRGPFTGREEETSALKVSPHSYRNLRLSRFDVLRLIKRFISTKAEPSSVLYLGNFETTGQWRCDRSRARISFHVRASLCLDFHTTQSVSSHPRWCKLIGSREQELILVLCFCCSIWEWFLLPDGVTSQPCLCYSASLDASFRAAALCDSAVVHPV